MKLVRYRHNKFEHLGIINHGRLLDLPEGMTVLQVLNLPRAERDYLEGQAGRHFNAPLDSVELLPPVDPKAMRDYVTFEGHISGMKKSEPGDGSVPAHWYEAPVFYFMNPHTVIGGNANVNAPAYTGALDYELEVAVILKKPAVNVTPEQASDYIAGYCILNDWSARDVQLKEMSVGLGPSKGKDFATTLGPWITTPDELEQYRDGDRYALDMSVSVNGVRIGGDNLKNMGWSFEQMIAHASRSSYVGAGDVLASGTAHTGSMAEFWAKTKSHNPPPLKPGDLVEMTVTGLGTIANRVVAPLGPDINLGGVKRIDLGDH
jgi:2-keto-4-pentenoate hydratase/2-oxohepta-3-ene-1,7-dioic acid hydratase in catechol pathway